MALDVARGRAGFSKPNSSVGEPSIGWRFHRYVQWISRQSLDVPRFSGEYVVLIKRINRHSNEVRPATVARDSCFPLMGRCIPQNRDALGWRGAFPNWGADSRVRGAAWLVKGCPLPHPPYERRAGRGSAHSGTCQGGRRRALMYIYIAHRGATLQSAHPTWIHEPTYVARHGCPQHVFSGSIKGCARRGKGASGCHFRGRPRPGLDDSARLPYSVLPGA